MRKWNNWPPGDTLETFRREAEEMDRKELVAAIREVRDGMGDPCQTLLKKRDEEGLTYGQLAEALKITVGTVMSRLARCMETLPTGWTSGGRGKSNEPLIR